MPTFLNITGQRFGRLTVVERANNKGHQVAWLCLCDCGNTKIVAGSKLRNGNTRSCRCLNTELTKERSTIHGMRSLPEYRIWKDMRNRCMNPNNSAYANYGGRGIKVCERWNDFSNFLIDMGSKPTNKHQIERINNDGDYSPENCKWASQLEQANNKRNSTAITYGGRTQTIPQWARELGLKVGTLRARIQRYNWPISMALTKEG